MLIKLARLTQKLSGSLLGSFAVAVMSGTVLICMALLISGSNVSLHLLLNA